jgi:G3E family GTPase
MSYTTDVYLITGFLGSGKTTFLNRIIKKFPKEKKLTILVNEFGEIGIDGVLVEGDDIDMIEISRGSIFCVCVKSDFIKGLYELHNTVKPDALIIESTGVANPIELKRDLQLPIFKGRFNFAEQFCIIDAAHFLDAYATYASSEKQIESSTVFIINKTDKAEPDKIRQIKKIVSEFHKNPDFFETTYSEIPLDKFFDFKVEDKKISTEQETVLTSAELEKFIENLFDNPNPNLSPPDLLASTTWLLKEDKIERLESIATTLPSSIVRAKGFIEEKEEFYIFDYVMGDWEIRKSNINPAKIKHKNAIVFIGRPDAIKDLENKINKNKE